MILGDYVDIYYVCLIFFQLNSFQWVVEFDGECSCVVVQAR